jgi:phosphate starvation-inducible PhoH-like protein
MELAEKKIKLNNHDFASSLGYNDSFLHLIEGRFKSVVTLRGNNIIIKGEIAEIGVIESVFKELEYMYKRNGELKHDEVVSVLEILDTKNAGFKTLKQDDSVIYWGYKDAVRARSKKQEEYNSKVLKNDLVFAIGPAGTGKTFQAVAMALAAYKRNEVSKIILSRPAVEAGESLGFLPGDYKEKLDPYIRPLTDALFFMLNPDKLKSMMEKDIIEITPLAYMRGRTLNNSFIILDEAQNATITQMKMFLTRTGGNSKVVITGDVTQIDLENPSQSGLIHAERILQKIKGIEFVYFSNQDVVRHKLVTEIIKAYEKGDKNRNKKYTDSE